MHSAVTSGILDFAASRCDPRGGGYARSRRRYALAAGGVPPSARRFRRRDVGQKDAAATSNTCTPPQAGVILVAGDAPARGGVMRSRREVCLPPREAFPTVTSNICTPP